MRDAKTTPGLPRLRILLAEDSRVSEKLAVRLLETNGHTVTIARNGKEAVDALERGHFDVILMDVEMPEMDGLTATRAIRARERQFNAHIPIIAVTSNSNCHDCLKAGMDAFLPKPLRSKTLNETLRRLVAKSAA